jgi:phosphoglucomutase
MVQLQQTTSSGLQETKMESRQHEIEMITDKLAEKGSERTLSGPVFVRMLTILAEADSPEVWDPAIDAVHQYLNVLDEELARGTPYTQAESAKLFAMLLTILAEAGQYRHETYTKDPETRKLLDESLLPKMGQLREHAIQVAKQYLRQPLFSSLEADLEFEIFPLLESMGDVTGKNSRLARDRYMPFRVVQTGNVAERLFGLRLRTSEPQLVGDEQNPGLLQQIYDLKYARFGTSGVRGRWGVDFTEERAKRVVQAICDYLKASNIPARLKAENLQGKRVVIGYDSRRNARLVAEWTAQVCLANGFKVDLAERDTPTPALVYYLTDYLPEDECAGLINCTASHNPPEWQGIKFNPKHGFPAPTDLTDFIAARANRLQLLDEYVPVADLREAEARGDLRGFDPIEDYSEWILNSGTGNRRIAIEPNRIRQHFASGHVVIDEMHGTSRGYLTGILDEIGVQYQVIHAERDPNLPGLEYANPEEPFINPLKATVKAQEGAMLGVGMDTDADRFGIVDGDGEYYRPNQILPMLVRYLGIDRELTGRVIATQTGSPLIEKLAGMIPNNEQNQPEPNTAPAFVDHPFYRIRVGTREDQVYEHTFLVPVGIKYIEEQRRTDRRYRAYKELPEGWRDTLLIGGEESSGLTTRGHVTDKDGVWANLLIMDMVAYYGRSVGQIWEETTKCAGWTSYGGKETTSNAGRLDVDAVLEAKEELINDFLDRYEGKVPGESTWADLPIVYAGGTRYDFAELQLRGPAGDGQHFLRVRASGTEPINRIYVESSEPEIAKRLRVTAYRRLEELSAAEIRKAHSEWRLAEILGATTESSFLIQKARAAIASRDGWSLEGVISKLASMLPTVELRNQRVIRAWIAALGNEG